MLSLGVAWSVTGEAPIVVDPSACQGTSMGKHVATNLPWPLVRRVCNVYPQPRTEMMAIDERSLSDELDEV